LVYVYSFGSVFEVAFWGPDEEDFKGLEKLFGIWRIFFFHYPSFEDPFFSLEKNQLVYWQGF